MQLRNALANLKTVILVTILILSITGCDEDPTSPCGDCGPTSGDITFTRVTESSFAVGDAATILVNNFVGRVKYRTGEAGIVRVRATRRATHQSDLDRIIVDMSAHNGALDIETSSPGHCDNVSVDLEITAPPGSRPRLSTGVGNITYRGRPRGACRFAAGVGSITLSLDDDVNITVTLNTGVGSIYLGLPVVGSVSSLPGHVNGRIGSGDDGTVHVSTGVGSIYLIRR